MSFFFNDGCINGGDYAADLNSQRLNEIFRLFYSVADYSMIPGAMLTGFDVGVYFYFASQVKGIGAIVDAGCLVGGTTTAINLGLDNNGNIEAEAAKIQVFDLFDTCGDEFNAFFLGTKYPEDFPSGSTRFRHIFEKNLARYLHRLQIHEGDIMRTGKFPEPIEFLGLDCCKSLEITDYVVRNFFEALIAGKSVVIHQDYIHEWLPFIHISMELLSEYFVPLVEGDGGGAYVWQCARQITSQDIKAALGENHSWYNDYVRNDRLLAAKQASLIFPGNRAMLGYVRARYFDTLDMLPHARAIALETRSQYPEYPVPHEYFQQRYLD